MPPKRSSKHTAPSSSSDKETPSNRPTRELTDAPPLEFICIARPLFDFEDEEIPLDDKDDEIEDEDDDDDDDDRKKKKAYDSYKKSFDEMKKTLWAQPAADHPDWKWVMQTKAWMKAIEWNRQEKFTDPDNFGMHIHTDFHGYGIQEMISNALSEFNEEYTKRDGPNLEELWVIISAFGLFLCEVDIMPWIYSDDGPRVCETWGMIGCAILTMCDELDHADELKPDSKFPNLGLVLSLFLHAAHGMEDYGIEDKDLEWRKHVVAYAEKAKIDPKRCITAAPRYLEAYKTSTPIKSGKPGRWKWTEKFKQVKKKHGPFNTHHYNITKMTRKERAQHAFDNKDPLAGISAKDIREGNLMVAMA